MFDIPTEAASLYKFYSFNPRNLEALSEPYIWLSKLDSFNDPFEGVVREIEITSESDLITMMIDFYSYSKNISRLEAEKIIRNRTFAYSRSQAFDDYRQVAKEATQAARQDMQKLSYFCLFRNNPERLPHEQLLMWSHYSDGLRGMRLEFDSKKLIDSLEAKPGTTILHPIKYVSEPPTISVIDYIKLLARTTTIEDAAKTIFSRVACKNIAWEYEQEYRLISHTYGAIKYSPSAVKEIVFGEKMPDSQKRLIYKLFRSHASETKFKIARISKHNYEIVFDDYTS